MGGVQDRTEGVMAEYYSGEAVIDFIRSYRHSTDVAFHMEKHINEIPAADVRPVVLCRDCKYAPIGDKDGSDLEWPFNEFDKNPCPHKCLDNWYSHKPASDFFCAAGKKREES